MDKLIEELRNHAAARTGYTTALIGKAADALESQTREIERLKDNHRKHAARLITERGQLRDALKAQPLGVVLPPMAEFDDIVDRLFSADNDARQYCSRKWLLTVWKASLDRVCQLNSSNASAGDDRAAFEAWYLDRFYMGDKQCGLEWLSTEPCGGYRHQHPAEQWAVWQARAALSANHSEQVRHMVPSWNLSADVLPPPGKPVLAYYLNNHGMSRRIRAMHVKRFTVEAEEFGDPDTQCVEYSEQDDCYYTTEGWYELIDNWPDYSSCAVIEGVITHWTDMPAAPSAGSQGGDV